MARCTNIRGNDMPGNTDHVNQIVNDHPGVGARDSKASTASARYRTIVQRWILPYGLFVVLLLGFTALLEEAGALSGLWWHKVLELPLVLYLYFLFSQMMRQDRWGAVIAAVPIFAGYALMDLYYLLFGRVFRLSELREVPELLVVLPWQLSAALVTGFLLLLIVFLLALRPRWLLHLTFAALPLVALVAVLVLRPDWFLGGFVSAANGIIEWSDEENVRWNGRFSTILYEEGRRREALRNVQQFADGPEHDLAFQRTVSALNPVARPRNVHILVIEGFVDPARMEYLRLSQDVLHPRFRAFLHEGQGDLSVSPVFGGYTAQAEFEILCGVPALQVLGTIEFNLFSGAPVHCLPAVLAQLGYRTVFTQGYKPDFFNAAVALPGLGFAEGNFAREYAPQSETYLSTGELDDEKYMFDSKLLEQNLEFVRGHVAEFPRQPLLNYVLTIYGHYPYRINEAVRPRIIRAEEPFGSDKELMTVINQLYYRSEAIAAYLERLVELDPDGIIVMVSDHLPPLQGGRDTYQRLGYLMDMEDPDHRTLLTVLDQGRPVPMGTLNQYDIAARIYDLLSDGQYCAGGTCAERSPQQLRDAYLQLMARAVSEPD
jgi:hypothetical protein